MVIKTLDTNNKPMVKNAFINLFQKIHEIPSSAVKLIENKVEILEAKKGDLLVKAGFRNNFVYLIADGLVRGYDTNDVTFWFGEAGDVVLSLKTYTGDLPGYESMEALEKTLAYKIKIKDLKELYHTNIHWANWGRAMAEKELVKAEKRLLSRQFLSAGERYAQLMEQHPNLLHRVPLGMIASYLGITQVSLSRIRAEYR
jgi:CRP-like cAMP-binding protein